MAKKYNTQKEKVHSQVNTVIQNDNNPVITSSSSEIEIIETASEELLNNPLRVRRYFRQLVNEIISEEGLNWNITPRDEKKTYKAVDVLGWRVVLECIHFKLLENPYLFSDGKYPNGDFIYSYNKFNILMDVYIYLCGVYGFIPNEDGFFILTGTQTALFNRWASSGRDNLLKRIREIERNTFINTFKDSQVPLERIYTANNLYNLNNEKTAADDVPELETLPDLLALPDGIKENCANNSDNVL